MSVTREEIATALGSVAGLSSSPSRPPTPTAGAAWPQWRSTRYDGGRADGPTETSWYVYVVVGGGTVESSIDASDPLVATVSAALFGLAGAAGGQLVVELVEPIRLATDAGAGIPALRFTVRD